MIIQNTSRKRKTQIRNPALPTAAAHGGDFPLPSTLAAFSLTAASQETRIQERAEVAQLVEHSTENAGVAGSIPALGARAARSSPSGSSSAVEHFLAKEEVAGSNPVSRPTQRRRQQPSMSGCGAVGSARRSGRRGRWFESSHPDHHPPPHNRSSSRHSHTPRHSRTHHVIPAHTLVIPAHTTSFPHTPRHSRTHPRHSREGGNPAGCPLPSPRIYRVQETVP